MTRKTTGSVAAQTRRKLEGLAAAKFDGGIGRSTIHVVQLGLDNSEHPNTMVAGQDITCSVDVDDDIVARITDFQVNKGVAKRTDATKLLIEVGLSVLNASTATPLA